MQLAAPQQACSKGPDVLGACIMYPSQHLHLQRLTFVLPGRRLFQHPPRELIKCRSVPSLPISYLPGPRQRYTVFDPSIPSIELKAVCPRVSSPSSGDENFPSYIQSTHTWCHSPHPPTSSHNHTRTNAQTHTNTHTHRFAL